MVGEINVSLCLLDGNLVVFHVPLFPPRSSTFSCALLIDVAPYQQSVSLVPVNRGSGEEDRTLAIENGDPPSSVSQRSPSATLAVALMTQLQFLATLSLVDFAVREDTWLSDFLVGLR